jgi:hypothetical protein
MGLGTARQLGIGVAIDEDIPCQRCQYNLRGLKTGERCPECGTVISLIGRARFVSSLTDAPIGYLQRLMLGCYMMGGAAMLMATVPGFAWIMGLRPAWSATQMILPLPVMLWAVGVWIVTAPRQTGPQERVDTTREWRRLRGWTRASQAVLAVGMLFAGVGASLEYFAMQATRAAWLATNPNPMVTPLPATPLSLEAKVFLIGGGVLSLLGYLGLPALAVMMARLADWANDTGLADRLRLSVMGIAGGPVLAGVFLGLVPLTGFAPLIFYSLWIGWVGVLLFVLAFGQFVWGVFQFASMSRWARRNALEALESDVRRAAKVARRVMANTLGPREEADEPRTIDRSEWGAPTPKHVVRHAEEGTQPLELAPPSDEPKPIRRHPKGR